MSSDNGVLVQRNPSKGLPSSLPKGNSSPGARGHYWNTQKATSFVQKYTQATRAPGGTAGKQGTLMGVIFPCMANILGVLLFLRGPWIVGLAGIGEAALLVFICCLCTFITALSLSAVSTNGKMKGGGSYFLISRSLGPSLGAGVGFCFFLANSLGAAMYILGCVEAWEVAQPAYQLSDNMLNNRRFMGWILLGVSIFLVAVGINVVSKLGTGLLFVVLGVILSMYIGLLGGPTPESWNLMRFGVEKASVNKDAFDKWNLRGVSEELDSLEEWNALIQNEKWYRTQFTGPDLKWFNDNWKSSYNNPNQFAFKPTFEYINDELPEGKEEEGQKDHWTNKKPKYSSFIDLLSVWFPACTGIMAGSNRSLDLKDPANSIPKGTLFAQISTSVIYISFMFVFGSVASRTILLNDGFFAATSAWPIAHFLYYGVIISCLNAGLQSLISGTRLLRAIAEDKTLPFLNFAANDRLGLKGLALIGTLCFAAIAIGDLNAVAGFLTMFFLICYFCVNSCCFILGLMKDANWRPAFRFYHWSIAFAGMIQCLVLMFMISWVTAILAIIFVSCIVFYASLNCQEINWGDGFRGLKHQTARDLLMKATDGENLHTKNWRPQVLVLTGMTPDNDEAGLLIHDISLIHFASQLKHGHGLCIVGGIVDAPGLGHGSFLASKSTYHVRNWSCVVQKSLSECGIDGFAEILYTSRRTEGIMTLIQTAGLGALVPNCVLVSWPFSWVVNSDARRRFIQAIQVCTVFQKTVLVAKEGNVFARNGEMQKGTIDIWWVVADGGILLLLPLLLRRHKVWKNCRVRLFAVIDEKFENKDTIKNDLIKYCEEHRVSNVEVHTVALDGGILFDPLRFQDLNRKLRQRESVGATGGLGANLTTKGLGDHVFTPHRNADRVWRIHSMGVNKNPDEEDCHSDMGGLMNSQKEEMNLRRNWLSDPLPEMKPQSKMSPRAPIPEFSTDDPTKGEQTRKSVSSSRSAQRKDLSPSARSDITDPASPLMDGVAAPPSSFILTDDRLESAKVCSEEVLQAAKLLNAKMQQISKDAALMLTNLPDIPVGESAFGYMQFVEHLCAGLPRCLLVRGTAAEVITAFT